jgi:mannose-6-phosphate isomerase-like protein (cupin superfamily)
MEHIHQSKLPFVGMSYEFIGKQQNEPVSFFLVNAPAGRAVRLHKHDYDEIVYVIEGRSQWTVDGDVKDATAGDVLIVHAGEPHKFVNIGDGPLRQIDIHLNPTSETVWLE